LFLANNFDAHSPGCCFDGVIIWFTVWPKATNNSKNSSFGQKLRGVPDGSEGSDGTSYPLTENYTLPVGQAMGRVA
jgi:hypothetical protein